MLKRIMLALTFVASFSIVGVGFTNDAEAWRRWRRPYTTSYYYPQRSYYRSYAPYRTDYRGYYGGPRSYRSYYYGGYPHYYYYGGPRSGVSVSFGF